VKRYFDNVASDYLHFKYETSLRSIMSLRQDKILEYAAKHGSVERMRVLDAGCGPGLLMVKLGERGYDVVGIDISDEMLRFARKSAAKFKEGQKAKLVRGDIEAFPFGDNTFDMIVTAGVLEYLPTDGRVLGEFRRVLKMNGLLYIAVTNKYSYSLILDGIWEVFRGNKHLARVVNHISRKYLGLWTIREKAFKVRKHSPSGIREVLCRHDFQVIDSAYFGYMPVPRPLDVLLGRFSGLGGNILEKLGDSKLKVLGEGYLLVCRNDKHGVSCEATRLTESNTETGCSDMALGSEWR